MTLHVLVPVHNRCDFTKQFLVSVRDQATTEKVNIVVIDDGSTDQTPRWLTSQADVTVVRGDGSLWWAGAIHRGLAFVRPSLRDGDFIYLGNNDTVLAPGHFQALLDAAGSCTIVGSVATEVWPDGTHHHVSGAFTIDPARLEVHNAGFEPVVIDGLAGRGLLFPADAVNHVHLSPHVMPQHFADLAMTWRLKADGFDLALATEARSLQLERAGSSVEFTPRLVDAISRKSQLYVPALWAFWWTVSSSAQRSTLAPRFIARAITQIRAGSYA